MIQNYIETLVGNVLENEFDESPEKYTDICRCPSCTAYVKAVALNHLPAHYTTSLAGEVYGEYKSKESQNLSDILVAVAKGVEALRRLPATDGLCKRPL